MYEESFVPDKLPGGGGFSIKNLSLYSLYIEHINGHNIFTHTNIYYPLVRYLGCQLKFYQSANVDYIVTYSNTWPLESNLQMYNTMQPAIHSLQKNKIMIPAKSTQKRKRPYKKAFIPPPTQMKSQWYFAADIAKKPLLMLRTSSCSFDHWYIGTRMISTNITIYTLNSLMIQNRHWNISNYQYFSRYLGTQKYYLYSTTQTFNVITELELKHVICLGDTKRNVPGISYWDLYKQDPTATELEKYKSQKNWGNCFHTNYLQEHDPVFASQTDWATIITKMQAKPKATVADLPYTFTDIQLVEQVRYNPYKDDGAENECYFLSSVSPETGWDPPTNPDLTNENLPLWILLFGFSDFQKKLQKIHHIDTDYIFVIKTKKTFPQKQFIIPISFSFYQGHSPYEEIPNPQDANRWYPCFQYQQETYNDILLCGPGTPKVGQGTTVEAKIEYKFFFKWGGEQPPMDTIDDPSEKTTYPIPNNFIHTTSLQNPTAAPETFLYKFDERRGIITKKAAQRLQKDWSTKETAFDSTGPRFAEAPQSQTQDTSETSESEEEKETTLYEQLQRQRAKQQRLKRRILTTLQQLQNLK